MTYHHIIRIRLWSGDVIYERWVNDEIDPEYAEDHYYGLHRDGESRAVEVICVNVYKGESE